MTGKEARFPRNSQFFLSTCKCQPSAVFFDNCAFLKASNVHLPESLMMALTQSISRRSLAISPSSFCEMNLPVFCTLSALHLSVPVLALTTVSRPLLSETAHAEKDTVLYIPALRKASIRLEAITDRNEFVIFLCGHQPPPQYFLPA